MSEVGFGALRGPAPAPLTVRSDARTLRARELFELGGDLGAVFLELEEGPQRGAGLLGFERARAKQHEGARPIDGLGDARGLSEIHLTDGVGERGELFGEAFLRLLSGKRHQSRSGDGL